MDQRTKIIMSVFIAIIVVAAGLIFWQIYSQNGKQSSQKGTQYPVHFLPDTVISGNNSLTVSGQCSYGLINSTNGSILGIDAYVSPPANELPNIYGDVGTYLPVGPNYEVNENLTLTGVDLVSQSFLTGTNLSMGFTLDNTNSTRVAFTLSLEIWISNTTNLTLYSAGPYSPQNETISPETQGFMVTYTLPNQEYYETKIGFLNNSSVNWYDMLGIFSGGTITYYTTGVTEVNLIFSGISIPPAYSLNLGKVIVGY